MAVEAQLCPQCGAAVQFGEGQTEVVCSHCGTAVVKPAAQGETSVEKELAAEKLVQETVGREKKLHAHGRLATGKIVAAQATDIFRPTVEGKAVLMSFALEVQPDGDGEAAFAAEAKVLVALSAVAKYRPGTLLDVRYDPQDRAQVSIEGRQGVKSVEERARERQAKEQARWKAKQAQRAEPAAAAATPAWGGPRPHGSVPVPVEFDQVTSLGPAAAVHELQGVRLLSNFGTPRPNVLVRYRDGLAYRTHGSDVTTWRWDEAAVIQSNVSDHLSPHSASVAWTEHEYTLARQGGEKLILDDGLKDIEPLIAAVKAAVFALIAPPLAQRYQAGEALTFGPVTIQHQNGLQLDGKPYAWDAIQDVKVDDGLLKVTLRVGQKGQPGGQARVSSIPNIEVLCQLIGVGLLSPGNLSHLV
jgi:ribosomal protein S27E